MKYWLAILLLLAAVALVACGGDDDDDGSSGDGACPPPGATASPTATEDESASTEASGEASESPEATEAESPSATATEAASPTQDPSEVFQIDTPEPGDDVTSPFLVTGLAAVFEAEFKVAVLAEDGTHVVDDLPARSAEGQTLSPFEVQVPFYVPNDTEACLQVYELSAKDGSRINVVQVPVTLLAAETPGAATDASASP